MTERDALQDKAANIAAHVKALQAFKKNCQVCVYVCVALSDFTTELCHLLQAFLECKDDLPDMTSPTPEPPGVNPSLVDVLLMS